ncbi:copper homeostasis periplasmic binding protein CopC [Pantoea sp. A4]|uniref:copper homeostasis periplasmic binding protein CopC n=1 Tax=Pantoea sp. A4 TaxID=1225184 RepID=UPI000362067F|nr:copper homeostasis periplasmic binding protein CopC [Pantoea sp. A4]
MFYKAKNLLSAALFTAAIVCSQQAMAHAHLTSSVPADMSSVEHSPKKLTLAFTEGLELAFSGVKITDASGKAVDTGKAELDVSDKKTLVVPLPSALKAGDYQVSWHALSVDGHKTQGDYMFSVK